MINLKDVITKYPECLESASKLRSYLVDLYPEEKARIRVIVDSFDCGIYAKLKQEKTVDKIFTDRLCNTLEKDYGYTHTLSIWCIDEWLKVLDKNVIMPPESKTEYKTPLKEEKPVKKSFSVGLKIENGRLKGIGTCKDKDIVIPDSVTRIGYEAFSDCRSLTSITIPDSVTSIGYEAFYNCSSLTSITIPDVVTSIGHAAFYGCSKLTSVTIPDSVTSIGEDAFAGCPCVKTNKGISYVDKWLIKADTAITSANIKDDTVGIVDSAFQTCSSLTSINIPDSVTSIGEDAFEECSSLTSITIPDSVTSIGNYAFSGCSSLTSINIPDSVKSIGIWAFQDCSSLTSITFNGTKAEWNAIFKGFEWKDNVPATVVKCDDGNVNI